MQYKYIESTNINIIAISYYAFYSIGQYLWLSVIWQLYDINFSLKIKRGKIIHKRVIVITIFGATLAPLYCINCIALYCINLSEYMLCAG